MGLNLSKTRSLTPFKDACSLLVTEESLVFARDMETEFRAEERQINLAAAELLTKHIQSEDNIFTCEDNVKGRPEADMFRFDELVVSILSQCVEND